MSNIWPRVALKGYLSTNKRGLRFLSITRKRECTEKGVKEGETGLRGVDSKGKARRGGLWVFGSDGPVSASTYNTLYEDSELPFHVSSLLALPLFLNSSKNELSSENWKSPPDDRCSWFWNIYATFPPPTSSLSSASYLRIPFLYSMSLYFSRYSSNDD